MINNLSPSLRGIFSENTLRELDKYSEKDITFNCEKHGKVCESVVIKQEELDYCPICRREERSRKAQDEILVLKIKGSNIPMRYRHCKLSDIDVETDEEANNMRHIFTWIRHFKQNKGKMNGFLMTGNVGSGKTHVACAMGRAVLTMGASFRYMTHEAINNRIRSAWSKYTSLTQEEVIESLSTINLLAIDELAECHSLELRKALSTVIDNRYNTERPTILVSNKGTNVIKEILGDRVYSRNCNGVLKFDGRDRRIDHNPFAI